MIERIISGGQTGVDRAALDVALDLGIPCGGWCPRGRWSESGPIDPRYPLRETAASDPAQRTARNVYESDATLIIAAGELCGGTWVAARLALLRGQPCLVVDAANPAPTAAIAGWLRKVGARSLNVAGPRESHAPGIHALAAALLRRLLA
jgi:putative molybdenum carrier protein